MSWNKPWKITLFLSLTSLLAFGEEPRPEGLIAYINKDLVLCVIHPDGSNKRELAKAAPRTLACSPDGKTILYWWDDHKEGSAANWDIWSVKVGTNEVRNLTKVDKGGCRMPVWAPDGSKIAYMRDEPAGLYVMDADGKNARRVANFGNRDGLPAWSPDGKSILMTEYLAENLNTITLHVELEDQTARGLFEGEEPAWSSNGKQILFRTNAREKHDIIVVSTNRMYEDGARNLTSTPNEHARNPQWSPQGDAILYTSEGAGKKRVCRMKADGSEKKTLLEHAGLTKAVWSGDGQWIAVLIDGGEKGGELQVIHAEGGTPKVLARDADSECLGWWQAKTPNRP